MKTIKEQWQNEIVINKSRFITYLFPVTSVEEANSFLAMIRKRHYDATHNCYAYIIGDNQGIQKASDDGEPQKTAGFPMLDVLKKQELTNILAITTRYFGGILLGAGGLVRAYSSSVSEALSKASLYEYKDYQKISITMSYSLYNSLDNYFKDINILDTIYTDSVTIFLGIDPSKTDEFVSKIKNASSGMASISIYDIYKMEVLIKHNEF